MSQAEELEQQGPGWETGAASGEPVTHEFEPDPLAHGLGSGPVPDGVRQPRRIATGDEVDADPLQFGAEPEAVPSEPQRAVPHPLAHGLGSADSQLSP
ncbi:MAG: hypothetical protein IT193_08110 [Propionibacteriaceae bacterium]|nr:hypothetical protein [Propionibacteriaceae bacterium]